MFTTFGSTFTRTVLGTVGTALCAGICLVAATAPANAATVEGAARDTVTRSRVVSYADLDVGTRYGRQALDRRVKAAAHVVCATGGVDAQAIIDESRCVRAALDAVKPQVVAATTVRSMAA